MSEPTGGVQILRRRQRERGFTVIDNEALRDERLSWKAVGLLAYLLSLPDGARVNREILARVRTDGKTATATAMAELREHGYLVHGRERRADGTFVSTLTVNEWPDRSPGNPAGPLPGNPAPDDPDANLSNSSTNTHSPTGFGKAEKPAAAVTASRERARDERRASKGEPDGDQPAREGPSTAAWTIARAVMGKRRPAPVQGTSRVAALAQAFLDAGRSPGDVEAALLGAAAVSQGSVEVWFARNRRPAQRIAGDDTGPVRVDDEAGGQW